MAYVLCKGKEKERIVIREIHLRNTGRHLSIGSRSITCHPTEVTASPSPRPSRLVLDLLPTNNCQNCLGDETKTFKIKTKTKTLKYCQDKDKYQD